MKTAIGCPEIEPQKCPKCGHDKITKLGFVWRGGKKVQRFQCQKCGYIFTNGKTELTKETNPYKSAPYKKVKFIPYSKEKQTKGSEK